MSNPIPKNQPYTIKRTAEAWGVSYHHVLRLLKRGEVKGVRLGRKWLVPAHEVRRVQGLEEGGA